MKRSDRASKAAFWVVVLLSVLDRCHLLSITMGYASDDLTVVWMAARDYAQGIFHEPFFYGQDYGVMLEALLAAPFVRLGADPAVAVPVVWGVTRWQAKHPLKLPQSVVDWLVCGLLLLAGLSLFVPR